MAQYSTTISIDLKLISKAITVKQSHTLHHGTTCTTSETNGIIDTWYFAPNADDSIGSQGSIQYMIHYEGKVFETTISFVCNNKLNNSVTLGPFLNTFVAVVHPPAEVIKTMAPVKAVITISEI